jgi:hypothetical protein
MHASAKEVGKEKDSYLRLRVYSCMRQNILTNLQLVVWVERGSLGLGRVLHGRAADE